MYWRKYPLVALTVRAVACADKDTPTVPIATRNMRMPLSTMRRRREMDQPVEDTSITISSRSGPPQAAAPLFFNHPMKIRAFQNAKA
jgi:hypothetical protein